MLIECDLWPPWQHDDVARARSTRVDRIHEWQVRMVALPGIPTGGPEGLITRLESIAIHQAAKSVAACFDSHVAVVTEDVDGCLSAQVFRAGAQREFNFIGLRQKVRDRLRCVPRIDRLPLGTGSPGQRTCSRSALEERLAGTSFSCHLYRHRRCGGLQAAALAGGRLRACDALANPG